jgi:hypothetical protein
VIAEDGAEYIHAQEAARILGVSQRAVRNLAGQQRLEVKTEGEGSATRFMVSLDSVQRLRSERQRQH